jgi:hypothetical protein
MWKTMSLPLVLLLLGVPALSPPSDIFRVQLRVNADVRLQAQIENSLVQELRRLGDIRRAEDAHDWLLHIQVISLSPDRGYVLSMVVLEKTTIALNQQALYIPDLHAVYVDTDLHALCARAVAAFDSTTLTPARAARRVQSQQDRR